jgi:hypothetical protein
MYEYKVEYEMMCYVKEYISECKPTEMYEVSLVRVYSVLKGCYLVLLRCSVESGRLRFERLNQGQEQVKDLLR